MAMIKKPLTTTILKSRTLFSLSKTLFQSRNLSSQTPKKPNPNLTNFSLPSDSDSDSETTNTQNPTLPPPYDPFTKKPFTQNPQDPTNLQEIFAKIREDGLTNSAVKMFDGLSQLGLTHEALELFSQIKDKGQMPDVVAHTAVIEAYLNAGRVKEGRKVYLRMLASGVLPNAYTYKVLIKGFVESGDVGMVREAKKCVAEMVGRGVRVDADSLVAVFEGLVGVGLEGEGKEMLEVVKEKGLGPDEGKVREALSGKSWDSLMSVLYGK